MSLVSIVYTFMFLAALFLASLAVRVEKLCGRSGHSWNPCLFTQHSWNSGSLGIQAPTKTDKNWETFAGLSGKLFGIMH